MSEFRFRILGISKEIARQWHDRTHGGSDAAGGGNGVARRWNTLKLATKWRISIASLFVVVYYASAGPSIDDVKGRRVLVLLDESGSMSDTTDATNGQLSALAAHNISVTSPVATNGYAISASQTTLSIVQPLEAALEANPAVDTVYFISDFKGGDENDNDADGEAQLRRILASRHLAIYLCTVDQPPPRSEYYSIPRDSGGGVIEQFKRAQ